MNRLIPILSLFLLVSCQGPFIMSGGGALAGEEVVATDWSVAEGEIFYQLEVRPEDPYSVNLRTILVDGNLYIDAAENRRWHDYMKADPRVRVRFGDKIYKAVAVLETDEEINAKFSDKRVVYRLRLQQWRTL